MTSVFGVAVIGLFLACTDKTYITNPPPDTPAIDRTPPEVWFVRPAGGSTITDTVRIAVAFFDSSGVDSIRLLKDGAPIRIIPAEAGIQRGTLSHLWETESDSDGVHLWQAVAWDRAGNRGLSETLLLRVKNHPDEPAPDVRPPVVIWVEPAAGDTLAGDAGLRFQIMDDRGLTSAEVLLNGGRYAGLALAGAFADTGLVWRTAEYSDGVWMMQVKAFDEAGNLGWSEVLLVRVKNQPDPPPPDDRTPPRISWIAPAPGSIVRDTTVLEFAVEDESPIDNIKIFVDGVVDAILAGQADNSYILERNTWRWGNGRRLIEIWACDSAKNAGRSEPIGLTVDNHKVIWVPDDFGTITAAINASVDGDTVRVRAGVYEEGLNLHTAVVLESMSGPLETSITARGFNDAIRIDLNWQSDFLIIRGFTLGSDGSTCVQNFRGQYLMVNCVVRPLNDDVEGVVQNYGMGIISNCVIELANRGVIAGYARGDLRNSIIQNCVLFGFHHFAAFENWFTRGFNLYWANGQDIRNDDPVDSELFSNPDMSEDYELRRGSPAIDAGDPSLRDLDGSRSDMGVHGGPWAYH